MWTLVVPKIVCMGFNECNYLQQSERPRPFSPAIRWHRRECVIGFSNIDVAPVERWPTVMHICVCLPSLFSWRINMDNRKTSTPNGNKCCLSWLAAIFNEEICIAYNKCNRKIRWLSLFSVFLFTPSLLLAAISIMRIPEIAHWNEYIQIKEQHDCTGCVMLHSTTARRYESQFGFDGATIDLHFYLIINSNKNVANARNNLKTIGFGKKKRNRRMCENI